VWVFSDAWLEQALFLRDSHPHLKTEQPVTQRLIEVSPDKETTGGCRRQVRPRTRPASSARHLFTERVITGAFDFTRATAELMTSESRAGAPTRRGRTSSVWRRCKLRADENLDFRGL
jgi:hypothetical protein